MARARKPKPVDSRMAFDFGPAPTSITIEDDQQGEAEAAPETTATGGPDQTLPGAAAMPISGARTTAELTDTIGPDGAQTLPTPGDDRGDAGGGVQVEVVTPRRDGAPSGELDIGPSFGSTAPTSDMSERSGKSGKEVNDRVVALLRAAEDAAREAAIGALAEAAEIAIVRGGSREIHDMILTELRRRYRGHGARIEYHLRIRGLET